MKIIQISIFLISISCFSSVNANVIEKVIYGVDNRVDVYQSTNQLYKDISGSTAAMIENSNLNDKGDSVLVEGQSLQNAYNTCSDVRFANQLVTASCSGFLIGDQYILTAGHCIKTTVDCSNYSWVFGFANIVEEKNSFSIPKSEIYKCVELIEHAYDSTTQNDFSLVKLDRPVKNRKPLQFRKTGKISDRANLVVIGHPSGLPLKISDDAKIRKNSNKYYFQSNLDTFGGNSGSAVFDAKTGVVEGILVRGEVDFIRDSQAGCYRPNVCEMDKCRGEDVTRITNVKTLKRFKR